ncbi:M48 family metallopeptidase [Stenoxybacter acetivorans]|uniref:M48 family metallopeptidase n=1 Tax=Stenoxybacter acetivorans TaxID=422441 RepID=UPI0005679CC9|nr:M48 family metallopeptidase [Stenoxybacter acetivorans]
MRFFEHQRKARQLSRLLIWLYVPAVTLMVVLTATCIAFIGTFLLALTCTLHSCPASVNNFWQTNMQTNMWVIWCWSALLMLILVLGGSVYRLRQLKKHGGAAVAEALGGKRVLPNQASGNTRQLLNVVEEMAIAAGLPLPKVYWLPESSINAFAAGWNPQDAVVAVTQGAIDALSRDELQAVVAHEFSHILNGDMRLNMRLSGLLHGLMMIGNLGSGLLFGSNPNNVGIEYNADIEYNRKEPYSPGIPGILLGIPLIILDFFGIVMAELLQASVSRQREFLADASAVQFTRQKEGLVRALSKIASQPQPRWRSFSSAEYAHFMFSEMNGLSSWLATHPPIKQRIARLDKRAAAYLSDNNGAQWHSGNQNTADTLYSGFAGSNDTAAAYDEAQTWENTPPSQIRQQTLSDIIQIHPQHLQYAAWLRQNMSPAWYEASQDAEQAQSLVCVLLLSEQAEITDKQWQIIEQYDRNLYLRTQSLFARQNRLITAHALPLLDLALPALAEMSEPQWQQLRKMWQQLMIADGQISLREWCIWTVLNIHLSPPNTANHSRTLAQSTDDIILVLAWAARCNNDETIAQAAFQAAVSSFAITPIPAWQQIKTAALPQLQAALQRLAALNDDDKAAVLQAVLTAVQADGRIHFTERDLMRTIAAILRCPIPPLLPQ